MVFRLTQKKSFEVKIFSTIIKSYEQFLMKISFKSLSISACISHQRERERKMDKMCIRERIV